jgi:hypothetical protein
MTYATQDIQVGARVCFGGYTDVYPATVISRTEKRLVVREDKGELLNGANSGEPDAMKCYPGGFAAHFEGKQRWDIQEDPNGRTVTFTWREKAGKWAMKGSDPKTQGGKLMEGWRKFHDFNF